MIVVPLLEGADAMRLIVALPTQSLTRLQQYDPAEIAVRHLPGDLARRRITSILLVWGTDQELETIASTCARGDTQGAVRLLQHLGRGWSYRPDLGDNDLPPGHLNPRN